MKILLVKLGAIGDVVQTAVALRHYRQQFPEHKVDWLTSNALAEFIGSMGAADHVLSVDERALVSGSMASRLGALLKTNLSLALAYYSYDEIVTAYSDWRYRLITASVFWKPHRSFSRSSARPSPIHHRNRAFEYWRLLSGVDSLPFDIAEQAHALGDSILAQNLAESSVLKFTNLPSNYVVVIPGGARNLLRSDDLRRWPLENYRCLVEHILKVGRQVVIAGGPADAWVRPALSGLDCIDMIGATNLLEMVHLLNRAEAVVTHDTGPMHLATMTRTPLLALFGPTPANAFVPLGRANTVVLQLGNKIACSPCYDGKGYAKCNHGKCMTGIEVDWVVKEVTRFFET